MVFEKMLSPKFPLKLTAEFFFQTLNLILMSLYAEANETISKNNGSFLFVSLNPRVPILSL